jgi:hypothetical protein
MWRAICAVILWQHVLAPILLPQLAKWARVERWATRDIYVAEHSRISYGESDQSTSTRIRLSAAHPDDPPAQASEWSTSILGVINGFMPFGLVLVTNYTSGLDAQPVAPYFEVRRRWW